MRVTVVGSAVTSLHARVVELVDAEDSDNLSPPGETPEVKPVKLGEGPGRESELMPSQALEPKGPREGVESRRRAPTAERLW